MWPKRFLVVWILLVSVERLTAASESPSSNFNVGKSFKSAFKGFQKAVNLRTEDTTPGDIKGVYNDAFKQLNALPDLECVQGSPTLGVAMTITNMVLIDLKKEMKVEIEEVAEDDFIFANVIFEFSPAFLNCSFEYQGSIMFKTYNKVGTAQFNIGNIAVKVRVKVPSCEKNLDGMLEQNECQNKISPKDIDTISTPTFKVTDVLYDSTLGLEYSLGDMLTKFEKLQEAIKDTVKAHFAHRVVTVVKDVIYSCLDEESSRKWPGVKLDKDCKRRQKL